MEETLTWTTDRGSRVAVTRTTSETTIAYADGWNATVKTEVEKVTVTIVATNGSKMTVADIQIVDRPVGQCLKVYNAIVPIPTDMLVAVTAMAAAHDRAVDARLDEMAIRSAKASAREQMYA